MVYIAHLGHTVMGHGKQRDVARDGARFQVGSAGLVVGGRAAH